MKHASLAAAVPSEGRPRADGATLGAQWATRTPPKAVAADYAAHSASQTATAHYIARHMQYNENVGAWQGGETGRGG